MSITNKDNLEERFDAGEDVLDYFDTDTVLSINRLSELAPILNISSIAREAGVNVQTLQSKIRRKTPLSGDEIKGLFAVLRKYRLQTAPNAN